MLLPIGVGRPNGIGELGGEGILTCMSTEHSDVTPGPDEFDRQLRDLYAGTAGAARFREPSAAERAKRAARRRRARLNVRKAGQAKSPRRQAPARRSAPAPAGKRRRLVSFAKGAGILIGFVALLLLMHALGLGPQ